MVTTLTPENNNTRLFALEGFWRDSPDTEYFLQSGAPAPGETYYINFDEKAPAVAQYTYAGKFRLPVVLHPFMR